MCGRYEFKLSDSHKSETIKTQALKLGLSYKEGEIFPGDKVLCLIPFFGMLNTDSKSWGIHSKTLLINARSESIQDKITFKNIQNNRCAVIANGFYEWKEKEKYFIKTNDEFIYLAAIYNEKNELVIITEPSKGKMHDIHERQPIMMNQHEMLAYLNFRDVALSNKELSIEKVD